MRPMRDQELGLIAVRNDAVHGTLKRGFFLTVRKRFFLLLVMDREPRLLHVELGDLFKRSQKSDGWLRFFKSSRREGGLGAVLAFGSEKSREEGPGTGIGGPRPRREGVPNAPETKIASIEESKIDEATENRDREREAIAKRAGV